MPLQIVSMEPQHIPHCAAIIGQSPLFQDYRFDAVAAQALLEQAMGVPSNVLCIAIETETADSPETLLGFVWLVPKGAFARSNYLRLIAVHPDSHRKGVGRALMEYLEASFLQPSGMVLLTSTRNFKAHQFYENLGYQMIGEVPDYVLPGLNERIYFKPAPRKAS